MDTEMEFEAFSNLTEIQSFFYAQSVFLTGVTGLVGKVVLEKLLRCCPGIGTVYIHMRPKRGLTAEQRLVKMFDLELFIELKKLFPQFRKRVQVVEGDITKIRLGMSFEDYEKIRQNVSIVIHSAASVNFNDPIKIAVEHNMIPTIRILELCHDMPQLKAAVLVSTAYVKREEDCFVLEKIPKTLISPAQLIDALEWMDEKSREAVSDFLLEGNLTTYLVTKAMSEVIVGEKRGDLPTALVRPAYVSPTWKDPFPAWVDTLQGVSGLLLAGAKGALRAIESVKDLKIGIIPVDLVTNTIVASAWHVGTSKPAPLFIINCSFDYDSLPDANEDLFAFVTKKREDYPLVNMFRYPDCQIYFNHYAYLVHAFIDQWIPAYIIDFFLYIFTGRVILTKVYKKINFLYGVFFRLGIKPWIMKTDNYHALKDKLSEEDEKIFFMNLDNFDWHDYMDKCLYGGRKFLAHEDPSNIPYAKKKAMIWWTVTTTLKWFIILYFFYYLFCCCFFSPVYESFEEKVHEIHP